MSLGTRAPALGYHAAAPRSGPPAQAPEPSEFPPSSGGGWLQVAATLCTGAVLLTSVVLLMHADPSPSAARATHAGEAGAARPVLEAPTGVTPAAPAASSLPPAGFHATPRVVYLVRTEDEAIALDAELNRAAEQRVILNSRPPSIDAVVVAGKDDIEADVRDHFALAGITVDVVDLRPR